MGWASKLEDETDRSLELQQYAVARSGDRLDLAEFAKAFAAVRASKPRHPTFDLDRLEKLERELFSRDEEFLAVMSKPSKVGRKIRAFSDVHTAGHEWVQCVAPIIRQMRPGNEKRRYQMAVARFRRGVGI